MHLGLAALILVGGIVAGWWFERAPSGPHGPVEMRNAIADSSAVVATFKREGDSGGVATTIIFVRDKGWLYERPAHDGIAGVTVISTASQTLASATRGCYIAIPDLPAPLVPGVNLASDLAHAPDLKVSGDTYTYHIGEDQDEGLGFSVREDLSNVEQGHTYTAFVSLDTPYNEQPQTATTPGAYTIRRATNPEKQAAENTLDGAKASPVATFTLSMRPVAPGQPVQASGMRLVSPSQCPAAIVLDPAVLGPKTDPSLFSETNPQPVVGTTFQAAGGKVEALQVIPMSSPFDAPADTLLGELNQPPANVPLRRDVVFGMARNNPGGSGMPLIMTVSACTPKPWFPC